MQNIQKTTNVTKEQAQANRKWYIIDAKGLPLGRLGTFVADLLRGKNKKDFTPNQDCGDFVIVLNANQIVLTGDKKAKTKWYNYSGFKGGLRTRDGKTMIDHYSDELITRAVKGMLPKNKLSDKIINKLYVYKDSNHTHDAQQPTKIDVVL